MRPGTRFVLPAALAAAAVLAGAGSASAYGPTVTHVKDYPSGLYEDDSLCSFPVFVDGEDTFTEQDFPDGTVVFHDEFTGTVTAGGIVLEKSEAANITLGADGSETWQGLAEGYSYEHGGVITEDRGTLTWDGDGNVVVENGPHPILDGPGADAVCAILAG